MTDRELIEEACKAQGLTIDSWTTDDDGEKALLGRWEATHDDPNEMFFAGDEGDLSASVVGAEQYRNRRVHFGFTPEGMDGEEEVSDPLSFLDPVTT